MLSQTEGYIYIKEEVVPVLIWELCQLEVTRSQCICGTKA